MHVDENTTSLNGLAHTCLHCGARLQKALDEDDRNCEWLPEWLRNTTVECECPGAVAEREQEAKAEEERLASEAEAKRAARVKRLKEESGMPYMLTKHTLRDYHPQDDAGRAARDFCANYARGLISGAGKIQAPRPSVYIMGDIGTGKTHLAAAIANAALNAGLSVIFRDHMAILSDLRRTYGRDAEYTEVEIMRGYTRRALLVVDDLGKAKPTEYTEAVFFDIVNRRYTEGLPTIYTSNYGTTDLIARLAYGEDSRTADAIVSRIISSSTPITMTGNDYRRMTV